MKSHRRITTCSQALTALLGLGVALTGSSLAQRATINSGLLLTDVTIVDTHTGKLTPHMTVVTDGGKITRVGRAGALVAGGTAHSVDAKGKFVVPGYWEMHAHPIDSPDRADNLTLMLAYGITGFRQMSGSDALLQQRKAGTLMPASDTPELLAMPGSILLRVNAGTVPQALAEVDKQKGEGADFIKTIDVPPPVFFAALDEATKDGLIYDGHLSPGVDAVKASAAGMRVIEHLGPMETILISCSTDEANIRQAMAARAAAAASAPPPEPASLGKDATTNPMLTRLGADPTSLKRMQHILDTYSDEKCGKVAQAFAANKTWQVPTLIRLRTTEFGDDPLYKDNPNLKYVGPATRALWDATAQRFTAKLMPADRDTAKQLFQTQLKMAKLFGDAGVPMLAGSDFGGMWLVAGYSLHQEFDLLAQAGFTPLRVLQMTTLNGAQLLGREASAGSVEVGKDADLVLLDGDPTASVANLHGIYAVVRGGKLYTRESLEGLKQSVQMHMESAQAAKLPAEKVTP